MPQPKYCITSALSAGAWALGNIDLAKAALYLDFVNVMCYDFSGPWVKNAGHQSQLRDPAYANNPSAGLSCQSAVAYYRSRNVPAQKIVIGIPAYGRSFLGASKPGDFYSGLGGSEGTFNYKELPRPGTKEVVDRNAGAAYCVGGDGGFVVSAHRRKSFEPRSLTITDV